MMAQLIDAVPKALFEEMFSLVKESKIAENRGAFYVKNPTEASTVNLFVWGRSCQPRVGDKWR